VDEPTHGRSASKSAIRFEPTLALALTSRYIKAPLPEPEPFRLTNLSCFGTNSTSAFKPVERFTHHSFALIHSLSALVLIFRPFCVNWARSHHHPCTLTLTLNLRALARHHPCTLALTLILRARSRHHPCTLTLTLNLRALARHQPCTLALTLNLRARSRHHPCTLTLTLILRALARPEPYPWP
jgi:hypothetical protein